MELNELQESKRSKTEEFEAIVALGKEEKRELTADELQKVEGLQEEVRELDGQITAKEAEKADAKRAADEALETELKDVIKSEIEEGLRAMSKIDANAEVEKAYAELDRAWAKYWEACEAEEKERKLEELRGLVKEILAEPSMRNEQGLKDEAIEAKRQADEKAEELEKTLQVEREAKEALENELKENKRSLEQEQENERKMAENKENLEGYIRGVVDGSILNGNITVSRAAEDGDTTAQAAGIPLDVKKIDVVGQEPIWEQMGVTVDRNVYGQFTLPYDDPKVAAELAELSPVTGDAVSPLGISISPKRFSHQKAFTLETMASAKPGFIEDQLNNMMKACDRKLTAKIYDKLVAGSTSATTGTTLNKEAFDALMGAVEVDGAGSFLSPRGTFFDAKSVAIDAGSGRFLVEKISEGFLGKGSVYDGTTYWYSSLFVDAANVKQVAYGDMSKIYVADYGMYDVIVDKFTRASEGVVVITVNKVADVALMNPNAFAISEDFDPAV